MSFLQIQSCLQPKGKFCVRIHSFEKSGTINCSRTYLFQEIVKQTSGILNDPLLSFSAVVNNSKAWTKTFRPREIVNESPGKLSFYIGSFNLCPENLLKIPSGKTSQPISVISVCPSGLTLFAHIKGKSEGLLITLKKFWIREFFMLKWIEARNLLKLLWLGACIPER